MTNNTNSKEDLRKQLQGLGAREFEIVALTMDSDRGSAAIDYAISKGAERPIPYAIKVFDNPDWSPTKERARRATNMSADVRCETCAGDRFIVHRTRRPEQTGWMQAHEIVPSIFPIEEMKPCPSCNADVDAGFWRAADGTRFVVAS